MSKIALNYTLPPWLTVIIHRLSVRIIACLHQRRRTRPHDRNMGFVCKGERKGGALGCLVQQQPSQPKNKKKSFHDISRLSSLLLKPFNPMPLKRGCVGSVRNPSKHECRWSNNELTLLWPSATHETLAPHHIQKEFSTTWFMKQRNVNTGAAVWTEVKL